MHMPSRWKHFPIYFHFDTVIMDLESVLQIRAIINQWQKKENHLRENRKIMNYRHDISEDYLKMLIFPLEPSLQNNEMEKLTFTSPQPFIPNTLMHTDTINVISSVSTYWVSAVGIP